jgi:hypothetical protein
VTEPPLSLPAHERLAHVLRSLLKHLPRQLEGLLEHARFGAGAQALMRFAADAHLTDAVTAVSPGEAERLAELLWTRWSGLAQPVLEPAAAIVAPTELWAGPEPTRIPVHVVVLGADPGWEVVWEGAVSRAGERAVLVADADASVVSCRVHVRARCAAGRIALVAAARVSIRRPTVTVRDDARRILVADQHGVPAVGVVLHVGEVEHRTGPGGLVELEQPAARGTRLRVEGVAAGRIPNES